jgi:hypothetical protein
MVAHALLTSGNSRDAPDRGDLGARIGAVYEIIVEGVTSTPALARPDEGVVGVGLRKLGQRP